MQCCGENRLTPFCPICGKELQGAALYQLLRHIRTTQAASESMLEKFLAIVELVPGSQVDEQQRDQYARRRDGLENVIAKWKGWGDALQDLLAKQ